MMYRSSPFFSATQPDPQPMPCSNTQVISTADSLTRSTMSGLKFAGRGMRTPPKISVLVIICAVVGFVSAGFVSAGFVSVEVAFVAGVGGGLLKTNGVGEGFGL